MKFRLVEKIEDFIYDKISGLEFERDFNADYDDEKLPQVNYEIAEDLFEFFESLVEDDEIDEQFTSQPSLQSHFNRHCINNHHPKSHRTRVLYDFTNITDFSNYESILNAKCKSPDKLFENLQDTQDIIDAFHDLMLTPMLIYFSLNCGFYNKHGDVAICFNSFANSVTTNYSGKTVDIIILNNSGNTVTMYPLDLNYIENKFNNIIQKHNYKTNKKFKF